MASCRRCGCESFGRSICLRCLSKWTDMRKEAFDYLQKKYGKLSPETHPKISKEIKRLDKLWKRNPEKFYAEISPKETFEIPRSSRENQKQP